MHDAQVQRSIYMPRWKAPCNTADFAGRLNNICSTSWLYLLLWIHSSTIFIHTRAFMSTNPERINDYIHKHAAIRYQLKWRPLLHALRDQEELNNLILLRLRSQRRSEEQDVDLRDTRGNHVATANIATHDEIAIVNATIEIAIRTAVTKTAILNATTDISIVTARWNCYYYCCYWHYSACLRNYCYYRYHYYRNY